MTTRIQSVHFDADTKLIDYIEQKMNRLKRAFGEDPIEAKVILKLEKTGQVQDKIVELIVNIPGHNLMARSTRKSFEEAIREAVAMLKGQWTRHKGKVQRKH